MLNKNGTNEGNSVWGKSDLEQLAMNHEGNLELFGFY